MKRVLTQNYAEILGFTGNADNLCEILDFCDTRRIYIDTRHSVSETPIGQHTTYEADVYYKDTLITTTPACNDLTGLLHLSCLYGLKYLVQKKAQS